jgi:predicted Zn-dependent protease
MNQAENHVTGLANSLMNELQKTLAEAGEKINGDDAEAALARGKIFQLSAYLNEAIASFQSALAHDSRLDEARARLAVVQSLAHQPENALATAMELAQGNPGFELKEMTSDRSMTAMTLLGDVLVANNRVDDAMEAYKVAANRYNNDTFAAGRLAQAYLVSGKSQKAIEQLPNFKSNPRFQSLHKILNLSQATDAVLPKYSPNDMRSFLAVAAHGRPMVVGGTGHIAPLEIGPSDWCAGQA